jgi:hypothetical protein
MGHRAAWEQAAEGARRVDVLADTLTRGADRRGGQGAGAVDARDEVAAWASIVLVDPGA